jgi:hypothetical protein
MNMKVSLPKRGVITTIQLVIVALIVVVLAVAGVFIWRAMKSSTPNIPAPDYWPTTGWRSSTPEAQGFDSDKLAELLLAIQEKNIQIHSLLLIRNGYVVLDAAFYPYDSQTVHNVASVTKSLMTTLIGIAGTSKLIWTTNGLLLSRPLHRQPRPAQREYHCSPSSQYVFGTGLH